VLKSDIDQFQDQMLLLQNQRQNDIWTLLERAVFPVSISELNLSALSCPITGNFMAANVNDEPAWFSN